MSQPPFYFVPLTHPDWAGALACARRLPPEAMAELRLDLFPDAEPEALVRDLERRCLVSCRRPEEGGAWAGDEPARLERLLAAARCRPAWIDLEWELPVPAALAAGGSGREVPHHARAGILQGTPAGRPQGPWRGIAPCQTAYGSKM